MRAKITSLVIAATSFKQFPIHHLTNTNNQDSIGQTRNYFRTINWINVVKHQANKNYVTTENDTSTSSPQLKAVISLK